jgi:hypothetical protein
VTSLDPCPDLRVQKVLFGISMLTTSIQASEEPYALKQPIFEVWVSFRAKDPLATNRAKHGFQRYGQLDPAF